MFNIDIELCGKNFTPKKNVTPKLLIGSRIKIFVYSTYQKRNIDINIFCVIFLFQKVPSVPTKRVLYSPVTAPNIKHNGAVTGNLNRRSTENHCLMLLKGQFEFAPQL